MKLLNTIIWGILKISLLIAGVFTLVIVLNSVIRGDKIDPDNPMGPPHNYWHPSWDENNPRTIIPEGKGTITYGDTLTDSIRWNESDEYRMWITGDGDTIWE